MVGAGDLYQAIGRAKTSSTVSGSELVSAHVLH